MTTFLAPAIELMNRLRLRSKFVLIITLSMIPLLVLSYITWSSIDADVVFSEQERRGIAFIVPLRKLMVHMAETRGMTNGYLNGKSGFKTKVEAKRREVDADFSALLKVEADLALYIASENRGVALQREWQALQARAFAMKAGESFSAHTALIAKVIEYINYVGHVSNLTLDPKVDRSSLGDAAIRQIPVLVESMGQLRGLGAGAVAAGRLDPKLELRMAVLLDRIGANHQALEATIAIAIDTNPALKKQLDIPYRQAIEATDKFIRLTRQQVMQAEDIRIDAGDYFAAGTRAIKGNLALYDAVVPAMDGLLAAHLVKNRNIELFTLSVIAIVLLLLGYLLTGFYAAIKESLNHLHQSARRVAEGDLTERLNLQTRDEMAEIGTAINTVAEGVGQTVSAVVSTSGQFVTVANRLAESSWTTGSAVESQVHDIDEAAHAIKQMAESVRGVASNTTQAAASAQQANEASANGQRVVGEAVDSINKLADDLEQVACVIKRLEEHSQSINSILEVIRSIAEQTNLLALNAAIEAARAGEQGRGFAVVADEVRGLARRTQESTLEIQTMIEQLQTDSQQAVQLMETSSAQAANSVQYANSAGDALQELTGLVATISDMNTRIAILADEQNVMATEVDKNIGNMTKAAEQSATAAQGSVEDSARATVLASEAQSLLKRFQIDQADLERIKTEHRHILFRWDDSYSVGIKEVDRQHRILIDMLNELYQEVKNGSDMQLLGRIYQGLIDYTVSHFSYEESLMERHGYEDLAAHKTKHKKLIDQVLDLQRRVNANDEKVVDELLEFLNDWLAGHIRGTDKQYGVALNAKGIY